MPNRKPQGAGPVRRAARSPDPARRPAQPSPPKPDAPTAQVRAPNRPDWPDPLNEEERAALEAGWSFVE